MQNARVHREIVSDSPQKPPGAPKGTLSQTLRIDIASEGSDSAPDAQGRKILTKRAPLRIQTPRTGDASRPPSASLGSADFQALFQNVYDAAIVTDQEGRIADANTRSSDFLQYGVDELRGMTIFDVISGTDASLLDTIRKNLVDRFVLIESCFCARKDRTYFPAEVAVNHIQLSGASYLCFFVRDISLRRGAEEQVRIEHNAVQNASSGIAIADLLGKLLYVNPAICRMWDESDGAAFIGKDVRMLCKDGDVLNTLSESAPKDDTAWTRAMTAIRRDGSTFNVQVTAAANRDADGRFVGLVFSFMDISDRRRAEEALRESERQRVMLESLGAACHHLSQPATVLLVSLGIMNRQLGSSKGELQGLVSPCVDAAETMAEVLHRMLAINEYRTTPYLGGETGPDHVRIIDLGTGTRTAAESGNSGSN